MFSEDRADEFDRCASEDAGYGLEDLEDGDEEADDGQGPGAGPYETLAVQGPQTSAGSGGHPDECLPCTFYCFTRRGCNRGVECRFCHSAHQSKLQQRRESWKKQQREKRKAIRERVAAETVVRRGNSGAGKGAARPLPPATPMQPVPPEGCGSGGLLGAMMAWKTPDKSFEHSGKGEAWGGAARRAPEQAALASRQPRLFCYSPDQHVVTVGQDVEFKPRVTAPSSGFRLATPCPPGLSLDSATGVIHGTATAAHPASTTVVEMEVKGGGMLRATIDIEVIAFTRGGYVVGHLSEYEKGRFMVLLYTPEDCEACGETDADSAPLDGWMPGYAVDPAASLPFFGQRKPRGRATGRPDDMAGLGGAGGQQEAQLGWW